MTIEEFSENFDTLVSSYRRFKAFDGKEILDSIEFNEYEKSVFLTKAQEEIVKELYSGRYTGDSFEKTEQLRRELEALVTQEFYDESKAQDANKLDDAKYIHTVFNLPSDCLYIIYEQVSWQSDNKCLNGFVADVIPVTHDAYWRVRNNPFRGPNVRKVLRLDNSDNQIELVSSNNIGKYLLRYLKRPEPIILANLPDEYIDGKNEAQTCKLTESIHRNILERAVRMALASKLITSDKSKDERD